MDEDQILVTLNEMVWFISQIDTAECQLADVMGKLSALNSSVNTYEVYYGEAAEKMQNYFSAMDSHLGQLSYFLELASAFLSNTLGNAYELDEEMRKAMDYMYTKSGMAE